MSRARRTLLLVLLLVVGATTPAAAFAVAPANDTQAGAALIVAPYATAPSVLPISPTGPTGGWSDATTTEDATQALPTCFGQIGYRSMWYLVQVPEASVLTVSLATQDQMQYRPLLTIISRARGVELACSLGANTNDVAPQTVTASSYVPTGDYLVRIASSIMPDVPPNRSLPGLLLETQLRDVTPPVINVIASGSVGVGKAFTFDARGSTDLGSQVNPASAEWTFYDGGPGPTIPAAQLLPTPLLVKHSWSSPGLHKVKLTLKDNNGNANTYFLNVFVHNFVPPKVRVRVLASKPGSRTVRLVVRHDMPVKLRLVILQSGNLLRTVPSKTLKGKRTATISIPLKKEIAKAGYLIVSGTASDLSDNPNTVPLKMCSVRPGKAGGTCA